MQPHETAPSERATSFQPVQGNPGEQYSGTTLLVTAYAVLWVVLFVWIAFVWRKQSGIAARLGELEREIDKTAASGASKPRA
jgi:CcmD family protein